MLLLRAALLEFLVCFHVVGGAVLFRRLFPRESPWLAFILPTLAVMALFNFIEHFIPLTGLGFLLPLTFGGLLWSMLSPGYSWEGLKLPTILFLLIFTWAFFIKCLNPQITCNTEGVADMARVLDFCFGETLPPTDSWCPPYDHGGYYSFQHYGASLLTRLFSLDIGTGYNMGYTLLNTLTCLVAAGAAYNLSGNKTWVSVATLLVLLANFTGSMLILFYLNPAHPDTQLSVDISDNWNDPNRHNVFSWIFQGKNPDTFPSLRLFTPTFNLYFAEFHANLSGHFLTIATLLSAHEAFKMERSNWPWICLLVLPLITILAATWFFIVVTLLCIGCLAVCLISSRRPADWKFVAYGTSLAALFLWPSVDTLISGSYPVVFRLTPWDQYTPALELLIQWWPVFIPWICLCFIWNRLSLLVRWIHLFVPLMLIFVEVVTFGNRVLTVEKMWGAVYSTGLVTFLPVIFIQRNAILRFVSIFFIFLSLIFFVTWAKMCTEGVWWQTIAFHLKGDSPFELDVQKKRLLQVLKSIHGQTVLDKSTWSYNQSPSLISFSENRSFIAWYYQEYQCGHGGEAEYRNTLSNDFFDGKMTDPLPFLRNNNIAAILIFPDDEVPDAILAQLKTQLGAAYYYIDCHEGGPNNAGVFFRQPGVETSAPQPLLPAK